MHQKDHRRSSAALQALFKWCVAEGELEQSPMDGMKPPQLPTGASETVTALNRAFFLDQDYLPRPSFFTWHGSVTLTPAQPQATLLSA